MTRNTEDFIKTIAKNVKQIMKEKNITQNNLVDSCKSLGYDISQSTISNIVNGSKNSKIGSLFAVSVALEVDIEEFFSETPQKKEEMVDNQLDEGMNRDGALVSDPNHQVYNGYFGSYKVFFYKTREIDNELIEGDLTFSKDENSKCCRAKLVFKTGDVVKEGDKEVAIEKEYHGDLSISQSMDAAYCYLRSEEVGEICMLVFHHFYIISNSLKCAMACAITTSSGANRRPTIHRMCILNQGLSGEIRELVKGQLLLNNAEIILSEKQLGILLSSEELPASLKELLQKAAQKNKCVCIQETYLYDELLDEREQMKWISYIRAHSKAQKYNKVSKRTEDVLAGLLNIK